MSTVRRNENDSQSEHRSTAYATVKIYFGNSELPHVTFRGVIFRTENENNENQVKNVILSRTSRTLLMRSVLSVCWCSTTAYAMLCAIWLPSSSSVLRFEEVFSLAIHNYQVSLHHVQFLASTWLPQRVLCTRAAYGRSCKQ